MANVIGLSQYHEDNLRKLAAYLLSGELKAHFDMEVFSDSCPGGLSMETICGTVGCAAGHGPYAGIPKEEGEEWPDYIDRQFGFSDYDFNHSWCFDGGWRHVDNTPEGAAKRILWLLDNGLPDNASDQAQQKAPLCYL